MALTLTQKNVRPLNGAIVRGYTVGGEEHTVEIGEQVYIDANDMVQLARTNAAATAFARGFVVACENGQLAAVTGGTVSVCVSGPIAGFTGMDLTKLVYTSSATAGASTQTAPSGAATWTNAMGYPLRSDVLMVAPVTAEPSSNS